MASLRLKRSSGGEGTCVSPNLQRKGGASPIYANPDLYRGLQKGRDTAVLQSHSYIAAVLVYMEMLALSFLSHLGCKVTNFTLFHQPPFHVDFILTKQCSSPKDFSFIVYNGGISNKRVNACLFCLKCKGNIFPSNWTGQNIKLPY